MCIQNYLSSTTFLLVEDDEKGNVYDNIWARHQSHLQVIRRNFFPKKHSEWLKISKILLMLSFNDPLIRMTLRYVHTELLKFYNFITCRRRRQRKRLRQYLGKTSKSSPGNQAQLLSEKARCTIDDLFFSNDG